MTPKPGKKEDKGKEPPVGYSGSEWEGEEKGNAPPYRRAENLGEDAKLSWQDMVKPRKNESLVEAAWRMGVNFENLYYMPASLLVSMGGFVLGALADAMGGERQEREMPWPHEGIYLIRSIARPLPQGDRRRKPSFAVKVVEVRPVEKLAENTVGQADAQLAELKLSLAMTQDPTKRKELETQIAELETSAYGSAIDAIKLAIRKKQAQLDKTPEALAGPLRLELTALQDQLALAENRAGRYIGSVFRPQVAFASEVTGQSYPLILQLGRVEKEGNFTRWRLSDVTSKMGEDAIGREIGH